MKKLLSFLTVICMCLAFILPAKADETDPLAKAFKDALHTLDYFYELDEYYMMLAAANEFCKWDDTLGNFTAPTVTAAEYEGFLNAHFNVSPETLEKIKSSDIVMYNATDNTYTVCGFGGMGGSLPERLYLGYVKKDASYDVFYQHITYENLQAVLPEGTDADLYAESLEYPDSIEYNGVTYTSSAEGYTRIKSYDDYGKKYNVEYNDGVVRIMSCTVYEKSDLPESFDDNKKTDEPVYDIPEDNVITIPKNECFDSDTTVKVEKIVTGDTYETVTEVMEVVAEKYVAYEFTATKDNTAVQPNGKLAVTFAIPEEFSTDIVVYYMATNGDLEKLKTIVDAATRTATAELEHFSTYILADNESKPAEIETTTEEVTTTKEPETTTLANTEDSTTAKADTEDTTTSADKDEDTTTASDSSNDNNGDSDDENGIPVYVWIIIAVVVIGAGVGGFFVIKAKKK